MKQQLERLLSIRQVGELLGEISASSVYRMKANGCLPAPIQLPIQRSCWPASEIQLIVEGIADQVGEDQIKEIVAGIHDRRKKKIATELL
tara:strand:- start:1078 stop:1347 length:270 start_codon:yes stop_codon:yes gene_type:complete